MLFYINDLKRLETIKSKISFDYKFNSNVTVQLKKFSLKSSIIYLLENESLELVYSPSGVCESENFVEILSKLRYSLQKSLVLNV